MVLSFNYNFIIQLNLTQDKRVLHLQSTFLIQSPAELINNNNNILKCPFKYGYNGPKAQKERNPIATGASCSTCSAAEHLPWSGLSQILPTDPQTGITMLCESGQPDRHTPCWVRHWQHHLSGLADSRCRTQRNSSTEKNLDYWCVWFEFSCIVCCCQYCHKETSMYLSSLTAKWKINRGFGQKKLSMQLQWGWKYAACISISYFIKN